MKKEKAIELVTNQQGRIEDIKPFAESSKDFQIWREQTKAVIKAVFGIDSDYYKRFNKQSFNPNSSSVRVIVGDELSPEFSSEEKRKTYLHGLECCDTMMSGMITEINTWEDDKDDVINVEHAINVVQKICNRFHQVARQVRQRHSTRKTIELADEYDVQDLLHALLKVDFDDVRAEEWTPSYAGSASRMDFLLKQEQIVIEVKKTRKGLVAKEVGEQLMIDIERYTAHPDCQTLVCFVYDPESRVANPIGIENDLKRKTNNLNVIIIITPK